MVSLGMPTVLTRSSSAAECPIRVQILASASIMRASRKHSTADSGTGLGRIPQEWWISVYVLRPENPKHDKFPSERVDGNLSQERRDRTMSRFFDLLPTDIHICLFQTWMRNPLDGDASMLRGMAALDSATSNHSLRPAFLHLMKLISLSESYSKGKLPFKQFGLIAWLQKLEVGVKSLYFYNDGVVNNSRELSPQFHKNRVCLPTVRSLVVGVATGLVCLQAVLCACPNVTQLA